MASDMEFVDNSIDQRNAFKLSKDAISRVREHENRVREEAAKLYGYRSVESYVAMYHDEITLKLRSLESIRMYLMKNERKKDPTLTDEKIDEIIKGVSIVGRNAVYGGSGINYIEDIDSYANRVTNSVTAHRIKLLCLEDQLKAGVTLPSAGMEHDSSEPGTTTMKDIEELRDDINDWLYRSVQLPGDSKGYKLPTLLNARQTKILGTVLIWVIVLAGIAMVAKPVEYLAPHVYEFIKVCCITVYEELLQPIFGMVQSVFVALQSVLGMLWPVG